MLRKIVLAFGTPDPIRPRFFNHCRPCNIRHRRLDFEGYFAFQTGPEQSPVMVTQDGVVYNGNHRVYLAAEEGAAIKVIVIPGTSQGGYPIDLVPIIGGGPQ